MRPSVVTALAFLGGAAMAEIPTQETTAISEAPDETLELSGGTVAAKAVFPSFRDGRSVARSVGEPKA